MNKNFLSSILNFQMKYPNETFAIAVSGGVDSMALLHWMKETDSKCVALTVDHGLRPESKDEAKYVAKVCKGLGIKHHILNWDGKKPKTGIEEAARTARYNLMFEFCKKNNIGVLITAHQADDQIETFLMNLARGSGVYGLAAIREISEQDGIILFRPMLTTPRDELIKYCKKNIIEYISDPMNEDEKFQRVKVRNNRKVLSEYLGISDDRILLAIENLSRSRDFIETAVDELVSKLVQKNPVEFDSGLLLNAEDELKFRALSKILQKIGENIYPLRMTDIKNALEKLKNDSKFTLGHCNIRKLNGKIRIWQEGTKFQKS